MKINPNINTGRSDINNQQPNANKSGQGFHVRVGRSGEISSSTVATKKPTSLAPKKDTIKLSEKSLELSRLAQRDREVRAHEQAHAAAGGSHAGSPVYKTVQGPDGKHYAVGGHVSIDTSEVEGNPEATLKKADQIRQAALAPAQPSGQDLAVAAKALMMAAKARLEQMIEKVKSKLDPKEAESENQPKRSLNKSA